MRTTDAEMQDRLFERRGHVERRDKSEDAQGVFFAAAYAYDCVSGVQKQALSC